MLQTLFLSMYRVMQAEVVINESTTHGYKFDLETLDSRSINYIFSDLILKMNVKGIGRKIT